MHRIDHVSRNDIRLIIKTDIKINLILIKDIIESTIRNMRTMMLVTFALGTTYTFTSNTAYIMVAFQ